LERLAFNGLSYSQQVLAVAVALLLQALLQRLVVQVAGARLLLMSLALIQLLQEEPEVPLLA
jgi:hypothetical protein